MADLMSLTRAAPPAPTSPLIITAKTADRLLLRGDADVMAAAGAALGLVLPAPACRAGTATDVAALWLGPDETLLILAEGAAPAASARLSQTLAALPHSLVDISHRQAGLEIRGPHAQAMLAVGCPLDLHISKFPVGMDTRTVFSKAEIVLWRIGPDAFRIEVWRSFRAYVLGRLEEAALEFAP
jgi:sarcosine oxidase subunit gamma